MFQPCPEVMTNLSIPGLRRTMSKKVSFLDGLGWTHACRTFVWPTTFFSRNSRQATTYIPESSWWDTWRNGVHWWWLTVRIRRTDINGITRQDIGCTRVAVQQRDIHCWYRTKLPQLQLLAHIDTLSRIMQRPPIAALPLMTGHEGCITNSCHDVSLLIYEARKLSIYATNINLQSNRHILPN